MENVLPFLVKVTGAGIKIVPLFLVVVVIYSFAQAGGKLTSWATGIKGNGLRKKAQDFRDYRENVRKGEALSGTARGLGFGKYQRQTRRELRNQAADASAKSGQAQFGITDPRAAAHTQSITQSNLQANAINAANASRATQALANNPNYIAAGMGTSATDDEVKKALASQQARALAEAIKDVELSATAEIEPGNVDEIAKRFAEAVKGGDSISAQAYQNMLMRSGGPGTNAYRNAFNTQLDPNNIDEGSLSPEGARALSEVKRNMLTNHGGVKETAADLITHASGNRSMGQVSSDKKTWSMSNEDLVKQKNHSLEVAEAAGAISSTQAREIQADEQLYRKLDARGRKAIDDAARNVNQSELTVAHEEALREDARRNPPTPPDDQGYM